jgi:hypothetical protein
MEMSAIERPALWNACSIEILPMRAASSRSACRSRRRIAERARPVMVSDCQSSGADIWGPRMISTTSPFCRMVLSGFSSPLILAPTALSPIEVCTA